MEPTERKEQLRKKFKTKFDPLACIDDYDYSGGLFDFFWKEIESRDRLLEAAHSVIANANDENMGTVAYSELVNKYHALKLERKQQSKT